MVRKNINHTLSFGGLAVAAAALVSLLIVPASQVFAGDATVSVTAEEMLTVQVTTPADGGASGDPGDFLWNTVTLSVATNNDIGFTATMTASTATTALTNQVDSSYTIPTLGQDNTACGETSYAYASFPANCWGYSVDPTASGVYTNTYKAVPALGSTPAHIANSAYSSGTTTTDVVFGTKATAAKASGTYSNTVVFNVVSGINTDDTSESGVTPTDPVTPGDDTNPSDNTPTYVPANAGGSNTGATVYTRTRTTTNNSTNVTTSTTGTTVTRGNTTTSTYVSPAGVTNTVNEGTPLATGLAVTAGVAATAGIIFFIVAKRRRDDDEEEDQMQ